MNSVNRRAPIHILLSLALVFSLGFSQNQSFAFAEDLSDATLEASGSSDLSESGQADVGDTEDTSGNTDTTEEVGIIEDVEEPIVSPSEELEAETNIEEVVEENNSLESLSSPRAGASIIVYDLAAFVAALADTNYSTIYLGADIAMTSATAQIADRALVIDGTDPDTGVMHSYTDYNSTAVGSVSLYGTCTDLTFQNIQVTVNNWYGIYRYTTSGTRTLTFDNVKGSSPQFYHYCNSVVGSTFIIKDSSLSLDHLGSVDGELAEADVIVFQGDVSIVRTSSPGFALFNCIGGSTRSVTVEDGSHVLVDMNLSTTSPGGLFYYVQSFAVGNNASFTCYSGAGMTYSQATAVTVGDDSDLSFHYTGSSTRSSYYLYLSSLNVGNRSSFLMYDKSSAAYGALRCPSITLDNPRSFVILNGYANASARAIGSSAVALSANNIQNIRYFSYSQIPSVYDSASHSFIGDGSVYSMWWTQQPAFALSASAWQGTSPGVTTTPVYDESNIPTAAIGLAQSTLTSSNFGVSTNAAAGIEISGETDATINVEYYFDDVHDDSYNKSITVDTLSSVTVSDVELGSVPTGYTLATTPTDPTLPQTAFSLDNTTVKVYYEHPESKSDNFYSYIFLSKMGDSVLYFPAIISLLASSICLAVLLRRRRKKDAELH